MYSLFSDRFCLGWEKTATDLFVDLAGTVILLFHIFLSNVQQPIHALNQTRYRCFLPRFVAMKKCNATVFLLVVLRDTFCNTLVLFHDTILVYLGAVFELAHYIHRDCCVPMRFRSVLSNSSVDGFLFLQTHDRSNKLQFAPQLKALVDEIDNQFENIAASKRSFLARLFCFRMCWGNLRERKFVTSHSSPSRFSSIRRLISSETEMPRRLASLASHLSWGSAKNMDMRFIAHYRHT